MRSGFLIAPDQMLKLDFFRFVPAPNVFADRDVVLLSIGETGETLIEGSWDALLGQAVSFIDEALGPRLAAKAAERPFDIEDGRQITFEDIVAQSVLKLQRAAGYDVAWYRQVDASPVLQGNLLAIDCASRGTLRIQLELALRVFHGVVARAVGALAPEAEKRLAAEVSNFPATDEQRGGSEDFRLMIEAARRRGIPLAIPLPSLELLQLGHGAKRRVVYEHFPQGEDYTRVRFSVNKFASSRLLREAGLPAQRNMVTLSEEQAVSAARDIGFPVVIKPNRGDYGVGINVLLQNEEDVRRAFKTVVSHQDVLVEGHVEGGNHRLLVMYGQFVAAVQQFPAQIKGDGRLSVRELVDAVNADRTGDLTTSYRKIAIDEDALRILKSQGYGLDDVPAAGAKVLLRIHSNLSVGGTMENVTQSVHPDNREMAVRAARVMGLNVAGIDFITTDVSKSWVDVGGRIIEINSTPGFILGWPEGQLEDHFLSGMFPEGEDGHIPTVYVVDEDAEGALIRSIGQELEKAGHSVAIASPDSVHLGATVLSRGKKSLLQRLNVVFAEPLVTAAVVQVSLSEIVREGLGLGRCALAVFGPGSAKQAERDRPSLAAARLLASVSQGVVVADSDGLAEQMAESCDAAAVWRVEGGPDDARVEAWQVAVTRALRASGS